MRKVLVAFVVALPLSYGLMQQWLSGFAYRVQASWLLFVGAGLAAAAIALATVGYHAFRAATANPVDALRSK